MGLNYAGAATRADLLLKLVHLGAIPERIDGLSGRYQAVTHDEVSAALKTCVSHESIAIMGVAPDSAKLRPLRSKLITVDWPKVLQEIVDLLK